MLNLESISILEIISIITMGIIAGATIWYTVMTRRLWKVNEKLIEQNRKLWELSRDNALCNYAENYLASFVQRLREDKLRETYMSEARKIVYDTLDDLLSSETADKLGRFRRDVNAGWTARLVEIKQKGEGCG